MVLSLALYSGRSVVGPVVNYLPGGGSLFLHRYIMGVHFAGLLLAGVGAVWLVRVTASKIRRVRPSRVVAFTLVGLLAAAAMYPVLADRVHLARANGSFIANQAKLDHTTARDVITLVDIAKQHGDGRIYAGGSTGWGASDRVGQVPLYVFPLQRDADSIGWFLATNSLSSDVEPYFNATKPAAIRPLQRQVHLGSLRANAAGTRHPARDARQLHLVPRTHERLPRGG